ncbi:Meiotic recombination protein rec8, partial [Colletotrichum chlorophyti]
VIATIGPRGGTRKVTRKAIEEVDIRKACERIIEPSAPISLRLQSNLLYGVSRVYSSQCNYVLADTEKVQTTMRTFWRLVSNNEIDPKSGKIRREQITLGDDPSFVPSGTLPYFTIDDEGTPCFMPGSQKSTGSCRKSQSQLSPFPDLIEVLPGGGNSVINLNVSQSPDVGDYRIPSPFRPSSSAKKTFLPRTEEFFDIDMDLNPFGTMNDFDDFGGVELAIDENGAVIIDEDEFQLPNLGEFDFVEPGISQQKQEQSEQHNLCDTGGDVPMFGSDPLPLLENPASSSPASKEHVEGGEAHASAKRRRRALKCDNDATLISRSVLRLWQDQYVSNAEKANRKRKPTTKSQARLTAYGLIFGRGIGDAGNTRGISEVKYPLAELYAGHGLYNRTFGPFSNEEQNEHTPSPKGRRRRATEAFGENSGEQERNVRYKVDEKPQESRLMGHVPGDNFVLGDESMPEMGMEAVQPMDEHLSSALMPWNRTPSVGRGSSVAGHSAQRHEQGGRHKSVSIRGSSIPPFEPLHDVLGSDLDNLSDMHRSQDPRSEGPRFVIDAQDENQEDSQWMRSTLDTASGEFLLWTEEEAKKVGEVKHGDQNEKRRWVDFDNLVKPAQQSHAVAAQAFYHVLSLATKNVISVEQQVDDLQPFGPIRIGVDVAAHLNNME